MKMKRNKLMIVIFVVLLFLTGGKAMAGPILDFTGGEAGTLVAGETAGWGFTVTSPITISALGLWDEDADGFVDFIHGLGLWTGAGTLLTSTGITNADSTPVASTSSDGDWRFTPVAPLTLIPGDYVVGVSLQVNDPVRFFTNTPSTIAGVTFDEALIGFGAGLVFPHFLAANPGIFGPNLFVESLPAAVPEPTTVLLLGSGLIGLAGYGRKKFFKK